MRLVWVQCLAFALVLGMVMTAGGTAAAQAASASPAMKPVPRTPIDKKAAELGGSTWNPQWNAAVEQALPATLLSKQVPRDVQRFCPRFFVLTDSQKRGFWAYFFQALAGAEAGLDPTATVRHHEPKLAKSEEVPANKVRSEGLLQLTYADQQRYGCPFDQEADRSLPSGDPGRSILQPKNNLICGVMILENQIVTQRKPLVSATSYWETLRPGTPGYRNFLRQMTNPPVACGLRARRTQPVALREKASQ